MAETLDEYIFGPEPEDPAPKPKGDFIIWPPNHWKPRYTKKEKLKKLNAEVVKAAKKYGSDAAMMLKRELCLSDLYYLCFEVLGYQDMEEPLHDDYCDFLAEVERKNHSSLSIFPRAHFKSTIGTIGRCIQWILRDRNIRIGLFSGDMKNARKFAREIKSQLESNSELMLLFPEVLYADPKRESPMWTQDEFIVRRDSKKAARLKEGTLKIFGLLQAIPTGDHFDKLLGDDIVDQEIVGSEGQMEKIEDQLQYLIPLQQTPADPIHYVGTHYHIKDSYMRMKEDSHFMVYRREAIERGNPIFPGRFNEQMLEETRLKIGNYKYQCQYLLDPQDPSDKQFKLEWLRTFQPWGSKTTQPYYSTFLIVDPANKQKKESDFTSMMVLGTDYEWNVYWLDGVHDKLNPKQRIDAVFRLVDKWGLQRVGYETIAFQDTDAFWIKREMERRAKYFQIIEISHRKQNKFDYILSTQPIYESGRFHVPVHPLVYQRSWENPDDGYARTVDLVEMFRKQYDMFPNLVHDDMLDSVALGIRIMEAGNIPRAEKRPKKRGAYAAKKKDDDDFNVMAH